MSNGLRGIFGGTSKGEVWGILEEGGKDVRVNVKVYVLVESRGFVLVDVKVYVLVDGRECMQVDGKEWM